jgi:hypothetical protein
LTSLVRLWISCKRSSIMKSFLSINNWSCLISFQILNGLMLAAAHLWHKMKPTQLKRINAPRMIIKMKPRLDFHWIAALLPKEVPLELGMIAAWFDVLPVECRSRIESRVVIVCSWWELMICLRTWENPPQRIPSRRGV